MSDVELKNIKRRNGDWENELWSLINNSDGINCPLYESCKYRENGNHCLSKDLEYVDVMHKFLDSDSLILPPSLKTLPETPSCIANSRIFKLIIQLARSYSQKLGLKEIPVSTVISGKVDLNQPVEVRLVPLKFTHGAVWGLKKDGWVIHLNSEDSPARRRFTLYHELFHILAHCNASPVFRKKPYLREGTFNELLADLFSAVIILPKDILSNKWAEVKDISKMAAIFDVPETIMYCGLKHLNLLG